MIWLNPVATWLQHFFGFAGGGGNGSHYLFWSGAASDLGEITLIGGMVALYRKHNCEVHGCWRLARHTTAANHAVCRRHNPGGAPTHKDVLEAHEAATRKDCP